MVRVRVPVATDLGKRLKREIVVLKGFPRCRRVVLVAEGSVPLKKAETRSNKGHFMACSCADSL